MESVFVLTIMHSLLVSPKGNIFTNSTKAFCSFFIAVRRRAEEIVNDQYANPFTQHYASTFITFFDERKPVWTAQP